MLKKLFILLATISLNAFDLSDFHENLNQILKEKYQFIGSYGPNIHNADILKAKYDLDFKNGFAKNEKFLAMIDINHNISVYKKKPQLVRCDAFDPETPSKEE